MHKILVKSDNFSNLIVNKLNRSLARMPGIFNYITY